MGKHYVQISFCEVQLNHRGLKSPQLPIKLQRMIESTIFAQKGCEQCILATNQAENQPSTKIKTKKKEDLLEVKFK